MLWGRGVNKSIYPRAFSYTFQHRVFPVSLTVAEYEQKNERWYDDETLAGDMETAKKIVALSCEIFGLE